MDPIKLFKLRPEEPLSLKELLSLLHPTQEIDHKLLNLHIVGILTGVESQLFKSVDGYIYPEAGISLINETEECSKSVLTNYSKLGSRVTFILDSINKCLTNEEDKTLTRIAYSLTLRDIFNQCISRLLCDSHKLDMRINYFSDYLTDKRSDFLLVKLNTLHEINLALSGGHDCSGKMLNILMDFMYLDRIHSFNIVSQLLISTLRPTLDYIESLLTNGIVNDGRCEFFFQTNNNCDPDHFWSDILQFDENNPIPTMFNSSWDYLCMGIKSRLLISIFEQRNQTIKIDYPKGCLFDHFLDHLKKIYSFPTTTPAKSTQDNQEMRLKEEEDHQLDDEKSNQPKPLSFKYDILNIADKLENDIVQMDLNLNHEKTISESHLPVNYTSLGIPFELALQKSLTVTLKTFIDPISRWSINHSKHSYRIYLTIFNDYFLLQRSNPEMRHYFEAVFCDITEGSTKPDHYVNWQHYTFTEHDVTAFLSQQRLTTGKRVKKLSILENIHLIYEEMDWTSRAIIDNRSKLIYDKAFQFLLLLTYCRWILDNLRLPRGLNDSPKKSNHYIHQLYIIRYRLLLIVNSLYNFIMNHVYQQVILLYQILETACNYDDLRESFVKFIKRIEFITMQQSDPNSKIVRTMVRKFVQLVDLIGKIWSSRESQSYKLPEKSEIDNFEKGFKIYLYNISFTDDHTFH